MDIIGIVPVASTKRPLASLSPEIRAKVEAMRSVLNPVEGSREWYVQQTYGQTKGVAPPNRPPADNNRHTAAWGHMQSSLSIDKPFSRADCGLKAARAKVKETTPLHKKSRSKVHPLTDTTPYEKRIREYKEVPDEENTVILNMNGPHTVKHVRSDPEVEDQVVNLCESCLKRWVRGAWNLWSFTDLERDEDHRTYVTCFGAEENGHLCPRNATVRAAFTRKITSYEY